jgi:hypothetical protein
MTCDRDAASNLLLHCLLLLLGLLLMIAMIYATH